MNEINRRTLLGVAGAAGAGLALSGCDRHRTGNGAGHAGQCEKYGEEVDTGQSSAANAHFTPDHVCGVYIRYENGKPVIRHAYADLTGGYDDASVTRVAIPLLKALRDYDPANPPPVKWLRFNFDNFSLGSQQVLVILLDNKPDVIRFNDDKTRKHIIRFTPYSGMPTKDPQTGALIYPKREENHAFFNLQPLTVTGAGTDSQQAYRLDFWNVDATGNAMEGPHKPDPSDPSKWKIYSMNIQLLQTVAFPSPKNGDQSTTISTIPTILDPDTGNMGSNP